MGLWEIIPHSWHLKLCLGKNYSALCLANLNYGYPWLIYAYDLRLGTLHSLKTMSSSAFGGYLYILPALELRI